MVRLRPILLCAAVQAAAAGQTAAPPLALTLQDALTRARANAPQLLSANIAAQLAHEDRVQAKAALLPSVTWAHQFIYTQPNGADTGVFIAANGPREFGNQAVVHADVFTPAKRAEYQRSMAAEAVARARTDIALRGLYATVVQNYYGLVVAERRYANARQSQTEAQQFFDITQKQERGGEAAHADVVKAQIQLEQRQRDMQDARLAAERSRIGFAVVLFPDYRTDYTVADDLGAPPPLPPFDEVQTLAARNNPDIRAAQQTVEQETYGIKAAKSEYLPSLSLDYVYGLDASQYRLHNPDGFHNLGSGVAAQMTIPVWTWGAIRSRVRQAELRLQQARNDLTLAQRTLLANLNSFYLEAQAATSQLDSLHHSLDLSEQSLKLTLLRYQAGEATALEVADAQVTLIQARNAYDDGLARYRLGVANLQTLTGAF